MAVSGPYPFTGSFAKETPENFVILPVVLGQEQFLNFFI
jgi:hypothetical protein